MAVDNSNFMDKFFPALGTMTRFWLFGLILAAIGGTIIWLSGAPETVVGINASSNYITTAGGFIGMWLGYLAMVGIFIGIFKSEGGVKGTDGVGSTKLKQGPIMAGIFLVLLSIFVVVYTVMSIQHM